MNNKKRKPIFMVHKHHATRLHYDLRLEIEGNLKSWALYSLPTKSSESILAIRVPDHPLWYRHFEGVIPEGSYGAGPVMIWDKGLFTGVTKDSNGKNISLKQSLDHGLIFLLLEGHKLKGGFILIRVSKKQKWFLIKMPDEFVHKGRFPSFWNRSVKSGKTMNQILKDK